MKLVTLKEARCSCGAEVEVIQEGSAARPTLGRCAATAGHELVGVASWWERSDPGPWLLPLGR